MPPVNLIVHYPQTPEGWEVLTKRVADVHASVVTRRIQSLNCPTSRKLELLDAVIQTATERSKEQA